MVVLNRSLAPLLRTTRLAVRQQKGISPIQQVFGKDANGVRCLATAFDRSKPHVNIGMEKSKSIETEFPDWIRYHWSR